MLGAAVTPITLVFAVIFKFIAFTVLDGPSRLWGIVPIRHAERPQTPPDSGTTKGNHAVTRRRGMSLAGQYLVLQLLIVLAVLVAVVAISLAQSAAAFERTEGRRALSAS